MKDNEDYLHLIMNGDLTYIPEAFMHLSGGELEVALLIGSLINKKKREQNFRERGILINELSEWFGGLADIEKGWCEGLSYLREFAKEHGYSQKCIDDAINKSCEMDNSLPIRFS